MNYFSMCEPYVLMGTLCFWGNTSDIHTTCSYHQGIIFSYSWISGRPWEIQTNGTFIGEGGEEEEESKEGKEGGKEERKKKEQRPNHLKYSITFSLENSYSFFWQSKNTSSFRSFPSQSIVYSLLSCATTVSC